MNSRVILTFLLLFCTSITVLPRQADATTCQTGGRTYNESSIVWSKYHKTHLYCAGEGEWRYLSQWGLAHTGNLIFSGGKVGIGTNAPEGHLHIGNGSILDNGTITNPAVSIIADGVNDRGTALRVKPIAHVNANSFVAHNSDDSVALIVKEGGNVGIGTNTPSNALEIWGTGGANDDVDIRSFGNAQLDQGGALKFRRYGGTPISPTSIADGARLGGVSFYGQSGTTNRKSAAIYVDAGTNYATTGQADIKFETYSGSSFSEKMRIMADGRVGMGLTNPQARLHVGGVVRTTDRFVSWPTTNNSQNRALYMGVMSDATSVANGWDAGDIVVGMDGGANSGGNTLRIVGEGSRRLHLDVFNGDVRVRIGNVGIGVAGTPTEKLQVNGRIDVSNNRILRVANPTSDTDASNKWYTDMLGGRTSCNNGQLLKWDGSKWECANDNMGFGEGGSGSTMVSGWPDAIMCTDTGGSPGPTGRRIVFWQNYREGGTNQMSYKWSTDTVTYTLNFATNGSYAGKWHSGGESDTTDCEGKSISQLYTGGQAFNFVGGGNSSNNNGGNDGASTMIANWPDAVMCKFRHKSTPTLAYDVVMYLDAGGAEAQHYNYVRTYFDTSSGAAATDPTKPQSIMFDHNGNYMGQRNSNTQWDVDCVDQTMSINQLYTANRAFNFVGVGRGSAIIPDWPNTLVCPRSDNGSNVFNIVADYNGEIIYSLAGVNNGSTTLNWSLNFNKSTRRFVSANGTGASTFVSSAARHCANTSTTVDMLVQDGRGFYNGGGSGGGGANPGINTVPIILSSGEKSGAIDMTETITIPSAGVLHFESHIQGANWPIVSLYVNGSVCAVDRSYVTGTPPQQYANATCIKDLPAGTHTLRGLYGETSGTANFFSQRMAWSVIAKNATAPTGGGTSVGENGNGKKICAGQTVKGVGWQRYNELDVMINVDTSACGFTQTPIYTTSLTGDNSKWHVSGQNAIYQPTPTGFRVYIQQLDTNGTLDLLSPTQSGGWVLSWMATEAGVSSGGSGGNGGGTADNLGNHTATQNINLNGHWLSGSNADNGVFVAANGNVGIGTNNPQYPLHMVRSSGGGIFASSPANGSGTSSHLTPDGGIRLIRPTNATTPNVNGYVDFSTTTSNQNEWARLSYNAGQNTFLMSNTTNNASLSVQGSVTAQSYFQSSDRNLKTDIIDIDNPFGLLNNIRGKHFVWKDSKKPAYGVIAQEVEEVMPDAVGENADGTKTVEYDQLIAPLIEAVKQLNTRVIELEQDNKALRRQLNLGQEAAE